MGFRQIHYFLKSHNLIIFCTKEFVRVPFDSKFFIDFHTGNTQFHINQVGPFDIDRDTIKKKKFSNFYKIISICLRIFSKLLENYTPLSWENAHNCKICLLLTFLNTFPVFPLNCFKNFPKFHKIPA